MFALAWVGFIIFFITPRDNITIQILMILIYAVLSVPLALMLALIFVIRTASYSK